MAEGQKLRWWQDEEGQNQAAQKAIERVTIAPPLLLETALSHNAMTEYSESENDTWAELEVEAARRVVQAKTNESQSVSFFLNKPVLLAHRRHEFKFFRALYLIQAITFLGLVGVLTYMALYLHKPDYFHFVFCLVGSLFGFWKWKSPPKPDQWLLAKETPYIRLESKGIFVDSLPYRSVFLPWDAVTKVKTGRLFNLRYLKIKTAKRSYTFEECYLTTPVESIAAQITAYRVNINGKSGTVFAD